MKKKTKKQPDSLQSPLAKKYALEEIKGGSDFWKGLAKAFDKKSPPPQLSLPVAPEVPGQANQKELNKLGYRPFCRVNDLSLAVQVGEGGISCVLRDGSEVVNHSVHMSGLGLYAEESDRTCLLARLYLASVTDDGEIDDMEARALGATARLLNLSRNEQCEARKLAYGILLREALQDGHLSLSEKRSLSIAKDVFKVSEEEGAAIFSVLFGDRLREAGTLGLLASDTPTRFRRLAKAAKLPTAVSKPVLSSIADSLRDQALADGQLPDPVQSTLKLKRGEHCRLRTKVTVSKPLGLARTSCLKIGKEAVQADHTTRIPIPPSGLSAVGRGDLFVTDERLILRSGKKSVTTRLERVTGLALTTAGVLVRSSVAGGDRIYQMEDPGCFLSLVTALHDRQVPASRLGPDRAEKLLEMGAIGEQILEAMQHRAILLTQFPDLKDQIKIADQMIKTCRSVFTDILLESFMEGSGNKPRKSATKKLRKGKKK